MTKRLFTFTNEECDLLIEALKVAADRTELPVYDLIRRLEKDAEGEAA